MKNINFKQDVLPHLLAIAVFLLLVVVYFEPAVLGGKQLKQSDAVQWSGGAQEINDYRNKTGKEALWTNSMFAGMPAYTISIVYSGELLEHVEKAMRVGLPYPTSIIFVSMLCFYIMMLAFGVRPYMAIVGAIAFTFFSFTIVSIEAGHNSKLRAMSFAPLVLAGIALAFRGKNLWGFVLAALGVALQVRAGHYQITYYLGFIVLFWGISELIISIKEGKIKSFSISVALLLVAAGLGIATNAARLWTLQEYTPLSMRGKTELTVKDGDKPKDGGLDRKYVFDWSNSKMETFTLLIPSFYGGSSGESYDKNSAVARALQQNGISKEQFPQAPYYWGDQPFTSGPVYAGAIICFLFVLGLLIVDKRYRYWLAAATLLSLILTWGRNFESFNYFLFDHFPAYNKFRAVTMAIFIAQLCLPLMALLALKTWLESSFSEKLQKQLFIAVGVTGGLALIFALVPSIAGNFSSTNDEQIRSQAPWLVQAIMEDRESMLRGDAFRSVVFILLSGGILWLLLKKKLQPVWGIVAIGVLVVFDIWVVDKRYLNKDNFERKEQYSSTFEPTPADQVILKDQALHYRVSNLQNPFTETRTSYFHHSLGGYSPAKIRRYQDLIENDLQREIGAVIGALQQQNTTYEAINGVLKEQKVLAMLNTKYFLAGNDANAVIPNPYAMGAAWFVSGTKAVSSADEEIAALSQQFDPAATAIFDKNKFTLKNTSFDTTGARIRLVAATPNHLEYESDNAHNGLAVFSEIYYGAGWKASIDGAPAEHLRVNYILRGMEVPAGKHKIVFDFEPDSYTKGNTISLVASLAVILLMVGGVVMGLRSANAKPKE